MTSTQRAARFKAKMIEQGFVQVNVWVPAGVAPDLQRAAELMREAPSGERTVRLVNTTTGRVVSLKGVSQK